MKATAKYLKTTKADATAGILDGIIYKEQAFEVTKKNSPDMIHVKLFAVSQDIRQGDTVYDTYTKEYYECDGDDLRAKDQGRCDFYKVLGELSPKAIWVKDGDIIEVDNLEVTYDSKVLIDRPYFAVKCPTCKQYY